MKGGDELEAGPFDALREPAKEFEAGAEEEKPGNDQERGENPALFNEENDGVEGRESEGSNGGGEYG